MKPNRLKNYLRQIEKSVGAEMFQSLYVILDDGSETDVANNGELSCAIHTSSILTLAGLIDKPHATVQTTLKLMLEHGWVETSEPKPGAVVYYPESSDRHEHLGFWLGEDEVVSNSFEKRVPVVHREDLKDGREPVAYYINPVLYE